MSLSHLNMQFILFIKGWWLIMAKSEKAKQTGEKNGSASGSYKSNGARHPLNVQMKKSEMSKADRTTLRASKKAYENRDKRVG